MLYSCSMALPSLGNLYRAGVNVVMIHYTCIGAGLNVPLQAGEDLWEEAVYNIYLSPWSLGVQMIDVIGHCVVLKHRQVFLLEVWPDGLNQHWTWEVKNQRTFTYSLLRECNWSWSVCVCVCKGETERADLEAQPVWVQPEG